MRLWKHLQSLIFLIKILQTYCSCRHYTKTFIFGIKTTSTEFLEIQMTISGGVQKGRLQEVTAEYYRRYFV